MSIRCWAACYLWPGRLRLSVIPKKPAWHRRVLWSCLDDGRLHFRFLGRDLADVFRIVLPLADGFVISACALRRSPRRHGNSFRRLATRLRAGDAIAPALPRAPAGYHRAARRRRLLLHLKLRPSHIASHGARSAALGRAGTGRLRLFCGRGPGSAHRLQSRDVGAASRPLISFLDISYATSIALFLCKFLLL